MRQLLWPTNSICANRKDLITLLYYSVDLDVIHFLSYCMALIMFDESSGRWMLPAESFPPARELCSEYWRDLSLALLTEILFTSALEWDVPLLGMCHVRMMESLEAYVARIEFDIWKAMPIYSITIYQSCEHLHSLWLGFGTHQDYLMLEKHASTSLHNILVE